jgi:hypothetical protein
VHEIEHSSGLRAPVGGRSELAQRGSQQRTPAVCIRLSTHQNPINLSTSSKHALPLLNKLHSAYDFPSKERATKKAKNQKLIT